MPAYKKSVNQLTKKRVTFTAKRAGICSGCGLGFPAGSVIVNDTKNLGRYGHYNCIVGSKPPKTGPLSRYG